MYNLLNLMDMKISGVRVLEKVNSPINGKLEVVQSIFFGTYIKGGGLPQSGGLALKIWINPLKKVKRIKPKVKDILILGLGGGGIVNKALSLWPEAQIIGIEIDPIMVNLGKKYLGLNENEVEVKITDANKYIDNKIKQKKRFDLILIDLYVKDQVPDKFNNSKFVQKIKKIMTNGSIAVFNRLYGGRKNEADLFYFKLKQVFPSINRVFPEANIMFICSA